MMVLDNVGDQEAIVYAQLGQQPLARTVLRRHSIKPRLALGTLSCLSARPPDLATATAAQPEVACVRPSIVPFVYSSSAHGGDAIPGFAGWTIERFVAVSSQPLVEQPRSVCAPTRAVDLAALYFTVLRLRRHTRDTRARPLDASGLRPARGRRTAGCREPKF